jgi:hypothetical protein
MTLENIRNICTQQILPPCSHSFDEGSYEANVTASMAATFGRSPMYSRLTGAEISYGELVVKYRRVCRSQTKLVLAMAKETVAPASGNTTRHKCISPK